MTRHRHPLPRLFLVTAPLILAGCGSQPSDAPARDPTPTAPATPPPTVAPRATPSPTPSPALPTDAGGNPDVPTLTPEAERGEKGARNLLLGFARAIELGRIDQARAMLSPAVRRTWSQRRLATLVGDLTTPSVAIPTGTLEGAAGSSFYTAPIAITGTDRDGRPVRIEGEAVLRRVNDVDGASAADLRWHFERLTLDWTH